MNSKIRHFRDRGFQGIVIEKDGILMLDNEHGQVKCLCLMLKGLEGHKINLKIEVL